jgi:hypothetical protein
LAACEFARVLRSGGRVGLSDLTRGPTLPKELDGLLAWIACIADAQPVENYADCLRSAGFELERVELHDEALTEMVQRIGMKLLSAEVLVGLKKLVLSGVDFTSAKQMAKCALTAIQKGQLGYAVLIAAKVATIDFAAQAKNRYESLFQRGLPSFCDVSGEIPDRSLARCLQRCEGARHGDNPTRLELPLSHC